MDRYYITHGGRPSKLARRYSFAHRVTREIGRDGSNANVSTIESSVHLAHTWMLLSFHS